MGYTLAVVSYCCHLVVECCHFVRSERLGMGSVAVLETQSYVCLRHKLQQLLRMLHAATSRPFARQLRLCLL